MRTIGERDARNGNSRNRTLDPPATVDSTVDNLRMRALTGGDVTLASETVHRVTRRFTPTLLLISF